MRISSLLALLCAAAVLVRAGESAGSRLSSDDLDTARDLLVDATEGTRRFYQPREKIGPALAAARAKAETALAQAGDLNEAYAVIADAVLSVDARIRFYPPARTARADYGWRWRVVGDAAYVSQLDRVGDAAAQGLQLGDKILSIDGLPLDRSSHQQLFYLFNTLSLRPRLTVVAQSPGAEPRELVLATTLRPQRRTQTVGFPRKVTVKWVLTEKEKQHAEDMKDVRHHIRRVGSVAVWKVWELSGYIDDIARGLHEVADASALILDFRGRYANRHEPALRLLDGLFSERFNAGTMQRDGSGVPLRVHGGADSFKGTVIVLLDSRTACYAEFAARVLQQRQRAVLIGDRTMGRVFEDLRVHLGRSPRYSATIADVDLPRGEVTLADGSSLDGLGVAPDLLSLPQPADFAGHRDVVLARALKLLKQTLAPEEAHRLFAIDRDDDDEIDD